MIRKICIVLFLLLIPIFPSMGNTIRGKIIDGATENPIPLANITIQNSSVGTISDSLGCFVFSNIKPEQYQLQISHIGYAIKKKKVNLEDDVDLLIELKEKPIPLKGVEVTPGSFSLMGKSNGSRRFITRRDIKGISLGEDVYRAVTRLPGITADEFSSKFIIRGGESDEILVLFDGLELYDPFHMKDFSGIFSIIDIEAIQGIEMLMGGFSAEYGNKKSGVFNMKSKKIPPGKSRTAVGISLINMRALNEGTFQNGKGSWFLSARRGYLDYVLDTLYEDEDLSPKYYDILGKLEYQIHRVHTLSTNFLWAGDKLDALLEREWGDDLKADSKYGDGYIWSTLKSTFTPRLFAQTVFSLGLVKDERTGAELAYRYGKMRPRREIQDDRAFDFIGIKQDWNYTPADWLYLKAGYNIKKLEADYQYSDSWFNYYLYDGEVIVDKHPEVDVNENHSGNELGLYFASRFRTARLPLALELGIRYDHASYSNDDVFSPRINLAYNLGRNTTLKAGWGYFYQSQGIHEMRVEEEEDHFYPAELAKHTMIGLEHKIGKGMYIRIEGYHKKLTELKSKFRNATTEIYMFPEIHDFHYRAELESATAKGLEFYIKKDDGGKFTWWASYALAKTEAKINRVYSGDFYYYLEGKTVPEPYDQQHTIYFDVSYRPTPKWHISAGWQYHSGRPYTERKVSESGYIVYDKFMGARTPGYHRLDMRINRRFTTKRGRITLFAEVINLYDQKNVREYYKYRSDYVPGQGYVLSKKKLYWLPMIPSIGIKWEW